MNIGISPKRFLIEVLVVIAIATLLIVLGNPETTVNPGVGIDGVYSHLDGSPSQIPLWRR